MSRIKWTNTLLWLGGNFSRSYCRYFKRYNLCWVCGGCRRWWTYWVDSLVVAICFALSGFFGPLLAIVSDSCNSTNFDHRQIMVLSNLKNIPWDDMAEAVSHTLLHIYLSLGFSYSITEDCCWFLDTIPWQKLSKVKPRDVHVMIWILDALSLTIPVWRYKWYNRKRGVSTFLV